MAQTVWWTRQELYYRVKYEKSEIEMRLIADACVIADAMMRAMFAVLRPGRLETEVAAWGAWVGRMLGSERDGFQIMVGANNANRTLIGPALNRRINEGDWVHLGVAPKRDGLTACLRRSVIAVDSPKKVTADQKYWFDLVEEAICRRRSLVSRSCGQKPAGPPAGKIFGGFLRRALRRNLPSHRQKDRSGPAEAVHRHPQLRLYRMPGIFRRHHTRQPRALGRQIVTMLDVALRGIGDRWHDVVIPGFDYCVVENTLGKYGTRVETLTKFPIHAQELVGA